MENNKPFEKIPIPYTKYKVFQEVLGVDYNLALDLRTFFWSKKPFDEIKKVEGITANIVKQIEKYFILDDQFENR